MANTALSQPNPLVIKGFHEEMDSLSSFAQLHLYALNSGCPQLLAIVNELSKELNSDQRIDLPAFAFKSMTNRKLASGSTKSQ